MEITAKRTGLHGIQIFADGKHITSVKYKPEHEAFIEQITKQPETESSLKKREEAINLIYFLNLQNTNGRETHDEMFKLGIEACYDAFMDGDV
ncbi:MAG: hypothetical protein PF486_05290 [Prolixibacteraceae bacterium]|jgi:hypothetical protein|nr:hypothetical protein [Prolixibacteraceae bacterium]